MAITESSFSDLSEGISISRMTEHDLLEVVEIEEGSGLSRWGWAAYYAELQSNNRSLMLVARMARKHGSENDRKIAGYVVARLAADELHINNVAVRPEYRGRGIGTALLTRVMGQGAHLEAKTAFLEVRAGNSLAQALYSKCGFGQVGRRREYYSSPIEDALVMSADLKG